MNRSDDEDDAGTQDDMPTTRLDRAREVGLLGARIAGTMASAGARGLLSGGGERERIWSEAHRASAKLLTSTLSRMRGVAAKFGQLLAQRPGSLPEEYVEAMLALTNQVPPMSYGLVKTQFLRELGRGPAELFARFEREPFAAASLGQVHRATLHDGREVAVKVQYPAVEQTLEADLANLRLLLGPLGRIGSFVDLQDAFEEVAERLTEELDYHREAANIALYRGVLADMPEVVIPAVETSLSTARVLTMELIRGRSLQEYLGGAPSDQTERSRFGMHLLRLTWIAEFRHHVLHVDPNPGNYLFLEDGRLGVLDFGCVKHFSKVFVDNLRAMLRAAIAGSDADVDATLTAAGLLGPAGTRDERGQMRRMARVWAAPFQHDEFDFANRPYLEELVQMQQIFLRRTGAFTSIPRDWVFFGRQIVGLTYLLYRLGARGRYGEAFEEFLASQGGSGQDMPGGDQ